MTIIQCEGITKFYGRDKIPALNGLNLNVPDHIVYGFLGPNGAGKTTTIRILTGLLQPSTGRAFVAGEEVMQNSLKLRSRIGYLGQKPSMYGWMNGWELLMFVGEIFGLDKAGRKKRSSELLEISGLSSAARKRISAYSAGMIQRLGIAQALVSRPEVLFLDEPTSALDPIGRKEVLEFIDRLKQETTVFMSTHILSDVERICDIVAIIDHGKLITEESIDHLCQKYAPLQIEIEFREEKECLEFQTFLNREKLNYRRDEKIIFVFTDNIEVDKQKLLGIIYNQNFPITRFALTNISLEDVFVKLVEKKN